MFWTVSVDFVCITGHERLGNKINSFGKRTNEYFFRKCKSDCSVWEDMKAPILFCVCITLCYRGLEHIAEVIHFLVQKAAHVMFYFSLTRWLHSSFRYKEYGDPNKNALVLETQGISSRKAHTEHERISLSMTWHWAWRANDHQAKWARVVCRPLVSLRRTLCVH